MDSPEIFLVNESIGLEFSRLRSDEMKKMIMPMPTESLEPDVCNWIVFAPSSRITRFERY